MQFIVIGKDGNDEGALDRRLASRSQHLALCERMKNSKQMLMGAALLDEKNKMIGSLIILDLSSEKEVQDYLDEEPYVLNNVWQTIEIQNCAVGPIFMPNLNLV